MPPEMSGEATGLRASWDRFFFRPADPRPLGLIRIATGLLLMWSFVCLASDLRGFLGEDGWVDQALLREVREGRSSREWSFWNAVPDRFLWLGWAGSMTGLALFTAGVFSRVTAPLAWAIAVSTSRRNPVILFGFDQVVTLWAFYLAVSGASGQAFSVDAWWRRKKGHGPIPAAISANLGLRMIQIQLAIIYGSAGVAKMRGVSWWDGSALIKILGNAEFRPFDLSWILGIGGSEYTLNLATHLALWTEVLYPVLIWNRHLRPVMLVAVLFMHLGIAMTQGLTEFSLAMLAGNLAFVPGSWLWHGLRKPSGVESTEVAASPRPSRPPGRPRR